MTPNPKNGRRTEDVIAYWVRFFFRLGVAYLAFCAVCGVFLVYYLIDHIT
jgi:peptidoglycan/LPS O-acetylase OafA/YrhL